MDGRRINWCCGNPECIRMNWNWENDIIEFVIKRGMPLICRTCGVGHGSVSMQSPQGPDFLECIPFTGWESRIPTGQLADGRYVDANGTPFTEGDFTRRYGVNPRINWRWRKMNKPLPEERCF